MAHAGVAAGPFGAASHALSGVARLATRHMRATVLLSIVLICGSFAAAATLQMQIGRERALQQAATLESAHTAEIAVNIGAELDRDAKIAGEYAAGRLDAESLKSFLSTHASALRNAAVVDETRHVVRTLRQPGFAALPTNFLRRAFAGRVAVAEENRLLLAFPQNGNVTVAELDFASVFPGNVLGRTALTDAAGRVLASGQAWHASRLPADLAQQDGVALMGGEMISAASVPGWPLRVANTLEAERAVGAWYGSLPLYLFVILGPALAGAGLAAVFVREFEKRMRANDALARLKKRSAGDARLYIRLAEAERRAAESERAKSELMAHVSHELRTPLNAIIGFSEIISHGFFGQPGHPKYIEYARDISAAGRELHGKIGDILEFANVEAGRHPIMLSPVDVGEIAQSCTDEMMGRAFSRRIDLSVVAATATPALADERALKRVLSNLISNALNFSPDGGRVRVEIAENGAWVIARIHDSGGGFSDSEAARAGEPFVTFERAGSLTGLGLGLAIATALAKRMAGALVLESGEGNGTTAELRLKKA